MAVERHKTGHKQGNRVGDHDGVDAAERSQDARFLPVDNGTHYK